MGLSPEPTTPLHEPLTARELEILRLMAGSASFQGIAHRLHLSPTTVKWYSQQIYGKLGIIQHGQKRRRAVARARTLGLLEPDRTPAGRPRYSLPVQTTPFVGRSRELDDIAALLADPATRLVTLFGPGGIGKTRLAVEAAWRLVEPHAFDTQSIGFPDGIYFVPLQSLSSAENVLWAVAEAVDYRFAGDHRPSREQLIAFFRKKRLLLLLDNFEHVLDAAPLVGDILQAAPTAHVLSTSREPLGLAAETVYRLDGLTFAATPASGETPELDAPRLFIQCAQRVDATFVLEPEDEHWLHHICHLVEGMPLALMLAAAWVTTLSLPEIANEIECCPEFLTAEMRDVPPRQWSIRALFEPTWQRLSAEEQASFIRLAVFRSGGTREAVQAVTGADLPILQGFVKKAVLARTPGGRYEIHELLRQFAEERLQAAGDFDSAHDAHCAYYAEFLSARAPDLRGSERQLAALADVDAEFDNLRRAWEWAVQRQRADILLQMEWPLSWYFYIRARNVEGLALFQQTLDQVDDRTLRGRLMARIGRFCEQLGRRREGLEWTRDSVAIAREQDDPAILAFALRQLGLFTGVFVGDVDEAHRLIDESMALWKTLDDEWGEALSWYSKAVVARWSGDIPTALAITEKSLFQMKRIGDRFMSALGYLNAGVDSLLLGDRQKAIRYYEECLVRLDELNAPVGMAHVIGNLGVVSVYEGDYEAALQRYEQAIALAREYGHLDLGAGNLLNCAEALALAGKYDQACALIAEFRELIPSIEHNSQIVWALLIEGRIAYRQADYESALAKAREALDHSLALDQLETIYESQFMNAHRTTNLSQLWLALSELKCGRLAAARQHLQRSLTGLIDHEQMLQALYGIAALNMAEADYIRATERAALVKGHPATSYEFKTYANALLAELRGSLLPEAYTEATARGVGLDPQAVIATFLHEEPL